MGKLADWHYHSYQQAEPFPHIVIDNLFPESLLDTILNEFPRPDSIDWQSFNNSAEQKLGSKSEIQMGEITRLFLYHLNSSIFINFLEKITNIDGLIPDPHFQGGELHQIEKGGFFKIHVDFNRHPKMKLDRRLNFLLFLNKNWKEEYGGHLQLWNKEVTQCVKMILPVFNRCVIFNTTNFSYHGHPDPLNCRQGDTRKSLALYYYTNGRPAEEVRDNFASHSTIFQARPGEYINFLNQ